MNHNLSNSDSDNTALPTEGADRASMRVGAIGALTAGATFIFGFAMFLTVFAPLASGELTPGQTVEFLADHSSQFYLWNLIIYVLFGIAQLVVSISLARYISDKPLLSRVTLALGLIWSGLVIASGMVANVGAAAVIGMNSPEVAATVWMAIDAVYTGMGGGNEIVGGLWILLYSIAAFNRGKITASLGGIVGLAGIISLVPALSDVGAIFGLGSIIWYVVIGFRYLNIQKHLK